MLQAAREVLLGEGGVTEGWYGQDVTLDQGQLLVRFTWRRLPYAFAVRIDLDELDEGMWTGMPVASAREWVGELSGWLMEEFDTGAVAWLPRVVRDGLVELQVDEPRVGQLPPGTTSQYAVSEHGIEGDWFVREHGLDPGPALEAERRGQLLRWWTAYVNNGEGLPLVAQLVVTGGGVDAHLQHLQVRDDLPDAVPDALLAELLYLAVWDAASQGARLVTAGFDHPALALAGLQQEGDLWSWEADGPVLAPPDVVPPFRHDPRRAALLDGDVPYEEQVLAREGDGEDDGRAGRDHEVGAAQAELYDDVERLVAYGQQHPDSWGGLRFDGTRLVVSSTDPGGLREAVAALVEHPDRVDVVRARRTERELARVHDAVLAVLQEHPGCVQGAGRTDEVVRVDLYAAGLPVAERLLAEHGDAVQVTVAGHRMPLDEDAVAARELHMATKQTADWPQGLVVEAQFDETTLTSGATVRGELVLTATTHPVVFESDQPLYGEFVDAQGRRLSDLSGFRIGTGWGWDLQPGQSGRVDFSAATHSARLADGPYVAAGPQSLVVPVPVHAEPAEGRRRRSTDLVAGPFPVTLRPPAPQEPEA